MSSTAISSDTLSDFSLGKGRVTVDDPSNLQHTIRDIMERFLSVFNIYDVTYEETIQEKEFHDKCFATAAERGYPMSGEPDIPSMLPFFRVGAYMASKSYGYLTSEPTKIFIGLYTTFILYLDDLYDRDIENVYAFTERYLLRQRQDDPVLQSFADLLDETPQHYERLSSTMFLAATFNYVGSLLLDHETNGMKISVETYPTFHRQMSGISRPFTIFIFPPQVELREYIHVLPVIEDFLHYGNDVLSFWKEELNGETTNYISMIADARGKTKLEIFERLAKDVIQANDQILKILEGQKDALEVWKKFNGVYIGFHVSCKRYRLKELMVQVKEGGARV